MSDRAVILDVDGTLVDSNDAHARAWVDAFAEAGITVSFEVVRAAIGMGADKLLPAVANITEDSELGRRITARRGGIFKARHLPHIAAFPGTRELVRRFLDDGFTIAVASSAQEDELVPLLERARVSDLIHAAASSGDAESSKPDPDIVHAAMGRTGIAPARTLMLGDTPYDVEAAHRAGIGIVALESGGWKGDALENARAVYHDVADLLRRYHESPFARLASSVPA